jgi:bifunctional UDP-N-acetylglucosamine pyrophosphorylase/glucosamine-1-phosphate N-acetyltransferase
MAKVATIVLCAGMGTRLKSATTKILHQICGRPLGYWALKNALAISDQSIVVLNPKASELEQTLYSYFGTRFDKAFQEEPKGTGDAVKKALLKLDKSCSSVMVLCGDAPLIKEESLKKLIALHHSSRASIALLTAYADNPHGYGRVIRNDGEQIAKIIEESETTMSEKKIREVNAGVYIFDRDFLCENIDKLSNNNSKKEYYITNLLALCLKDQSLSGPIQSVEIDFEEMLGINTRIQLAQAHKIMNRRLLEKHMLEGVTIIDPDNTYIEEGVLLEQDIVIYPGVFLRGNTSIQSGAIIENGVILNNTHVGHNAHLLAYSWCDQAFIGERTRVGPFARLRAQTYLESDVVVGNFIEIKKSRIKSGTKAPHVAYLGDSNIGNNCNIGAGAITCNYDGKDKHNTVIEDQVFIGSNATLIAPLTIGENSYIAGGSVINKEVPPHSLALGRAHQITKERKLIDSPEKIDKLEK